MVKAETINLSSAKPPPKTISKYSREMVPPSEFVMEDSSITRRTLHDIQNFFGLREPPAATHEIPSALEHRYSENLVNSRTDDGSTEQAEVPKDANEAVTFNI